MNADIIVLAEKLLKERSSFKEEDKFKDSISAVTTFVLRTKEFERADELIDTTGLPCDPSVCLTYLREYLHKDISKSSVKYCLEKYEYLRCGRNDEQTH